MDEVFGEETLVSMITFKKSLPLGSAGLPSICDYIIWFSKDKNMKVRNLFEKKPLGAGTGYTWIREDSLKKRKMTSERGMIHLKLILPSTFLCR